MKRLFAVLMCLVLVFGMAACGGPSESGETENVVTIAVADEFTTFDPMETSAEANQIVQDLVFDMLTDTDLKDVSTASLSKNTRASASKAKLSR